MLEQANGVFKVPPSRIVYYYSVWQPVFDDMKKNISNIYFKQGLPESENEFLDFVDEKSHIVCVFDDSLQDIANSLFVQKQFCVNSHHYNASIINTLNPKFVSKRKCHENNKS